MKTRFPPPRFTRFSAVLLITLAALALFAGAAAAGLHRVGPINPTPSVGNFPAWYQDNTGITLEFCDPKNAAEVAGGWCLLLPADVTVPPTEVFPDNFFDEHFYFSAGTDPVPETPGSSLNRAVLVLALESAFATGPATPGAQITFARIRVDVRMPNGQFFAPGTYRFIHPYGELLPPFVVSAPNTIDRIFITEDVGVGNFAGVLDNSSRLGPFLLPSNTPGGAELPAVAGPAPGKLYIADPGRSGPVTGSALPNFTACPNSNPCSPGISTNHNVFRIEGPIGSNLGGTGVNFIQTTNFALVGRLFSGEMPGDVTVERAEYTRNTAGEKVEVYATGLMTLPKRLPAGPPPAPFRPVLSFFNDNCVLGADGYTYAAPGGANTAMFNADDSFWAQNPSIPAEVCVVDSVSDAGFPKAVGDAIIISEAYYNPIAHTLSVRARSGDEVSNPLPTLTLEGFEGLGPIVNGSILVSPLDAPPAYAWVNSDHGGSNAVQVTTTPLPASAPPPVENVTLTASPVDNTLTGNNVTFTASASGGSGSYEYQFMAKTAPAGPFGIAQAYGATDNNIWIWNTTGFPPGIYEIQVFARSVGSTAPVEAVATVVYTLTVPPTTSVGLTAAPVSPVSVDNDVLFTATPTVGGTPTHEYQFWYKSVTAPTFSMAQDYSATNTFTWKATAGSYEWKVFARSTGSTAVSEAVSPIVPFVVNSSTAAATGASLFATPTSSQPQGTPVTFIAVGAGGSLIYEYKFSYRLSGAPTYTVGQDYSSSSIWNWNTAAIPSGGYDILANVRSVGSTAASEASATASYLFTGTGAGINVVVGPTPVSPQAPGASVLFTAVASGGSGSYQYQFWLNDGTSWSIAKPYGATNDNTWTWNTTGLATGTYSVQVWVRDAGSTAAYEAFTPVVTYVLGVTTPVTSVTLTPPPSPASPQAPGTSVLFTAAAGGGSGTPEYQFWLHNGTSWSIARAYSTTATWTWNTSGLPTGTYSVQVWARNAGSGAANEAFTPVATYVLGTAATPVGTVVLNPPPSPASPQAPGASVLFTAVASGGSATPEYQFWLHNGTAWSIARAYSTTATWTWNTSGLPTGTYSVQVWARNVGSAAAYEAFITVASYVLQP